MTSCSAPPPPSWGSYGTWARSGTSGAVPDGGAPRGNARRAPAALAAPARHLQRTTATAKMRHLRGLDCVKSLWSFYTGLYPRRRCDCSLRESRDAEACHLQRGCAFVVYRGTSRIRNCLLPGPYSRAIPRALWWSQGAGCFLVSEVPLYGSVWGQGRARRPTRGVPAPSTRPCPTPYRGTSLIRNSAPLGPYSTNRPRALWWS